MGFEALRDVKANGLTPVHGDEGVLTPPPAGHSPHFGHGLKAAEIQGLDCLALDPCDSSGPAAGVVGERQKFDGHRALLFTTAAPGRRVLLQTRRGSLVQERFADRVVAA
ncbi:hypothetical protein [Streptomyces sp. NPDC086989]|uniref:hypothetical protein n=1 Tax=Streptomyces sp. NPDC086989 TaxID=3365764 RepID=UPI003830172D